MIDDLNALLHAELRYAYFNARRTASEAAPTGIVLADSAEVPHVLDSGRPDNVYYNRAVVPPTCGCVAEVLDTLSAAVQAIELAAGAINLTLLGLNMRDGLKMTAKRRRTGRNR